MTPLLIIYFGAGTASIVTDVSYQSANLCSGTAAVDVAVASLVSLSESANLCSGTAPTPTPTRSVLAVNQF